MVQLNYTFIVQLISFLVFMALFNRIALRPIRAIIKDRGIKQEEILADIESFSSQADDKLAGYENSLMSTKRDGQQLRLASKIDGEVGAKEILEHAQQESITDIESARQKISSEVREALTSLRSKIKIYAEQAAHKILEA